MIKKICQEVDDHLRLLMHTILIEKLKGRNPFEMPLKPIHQYLMNGPIDVFGVIIDPIEQVIHFSPASNAVLFRFLSILMRHSTT